jgi:uncharacterized protein (TIGR02145 family)
VRKLLVVHGIATVFLVLGACSQATPAGNGQQADTADTLLTGKDAAAVPDGKSIDSEGDSTIGSDSGEGLAPTCPGAVGCSCAIASDCTNGLCLDTSDGKRCAAPCESGCGTDQACANLPGAGGQSFNVCVGKWGKLCYPCSATKDCEEPGIAGSICANEGVLGSFCGAKCATAADCPSGYDCQVAQSPEGPKTLQCIRVGADGKTPATCSCTQAAKDAALTTACFAEQKDLSGKVVAKCPGVRICGPTGLSDCTLVAPKAEKCDGVDNDCNGEIDDGTSDCPSGTTCTAGKCLNPCTAVDGGWSAWVPGTCSAKCGSGTLISTRTCSAPAPACGGQACSGDAQKSETCTSQSGCDFPCGNALTDSRDGKTYSTVLIGSQCWMAQNLNYGAMISRDGDQTDNAVAEKYCFDDSPANCLSYGALYQWPEMMNYAPSSNATPSGVQGPCPVGWHVPSHFEWVSLELAVCTSNSCATDFPLDLTTTGARGTDEGGKLKEVGLTHWLTPNTGANNSSGFTALAAGYEFSASGAFNTGLGDYADVWTATEGTADTGWYRELWFNNTSVYRMNSAGKTAGFSVRCVKD